MSTVLIITNYFLKVINYKCIFSVQDEGDWTDLAGAIERSKQTGQQELSGRGLGIIVGFVDHQLMIDGKVVIVKLF